MSVFTHGVTTKGKPRLINRNQVFTVVLRRKLLSMLGSGAWLTAMTRSPWGPALLRKQTGQPVLFRRYVPPYPTKSAVLRP